MSAPNHPCIAWAKRTGTALGTLTPWQQAAITLFVAGLGTFIYLQTDGGSQLTPASQSSANSTGTQRMTSADGGLGHRPGPAGSVESPESNQLGRHTWKVFNSLSITEMPAVLEKKRVHALESDLADAIRQMPVVDDASVSFDERAVRGLSTPRMVSANVILKLKKNSDQPVDNHWLRTIRTMVAGSDVDLQEENVRIVDLTNGRIYTSDDANGLADVEWGKLNMKRSQEKYWEDKIGRVLTSLQEDFEISVTVNDAFAQASPTDNDDSPETDKTLQRGEIVASVFLKRDISRLSSDSQWQQQHATLVGTLQAMDPRMHVSIFAVPREESPQLAAQPWTLPWAQGKWAEATANRHQNWNVAAAGIVLIVIWSLCVGFRRRRIRAQLNALRAEASATYYEEPAEEYVEEQDLVSRVGTIVRDNPDVAAQVIHNWMRKAG